MVHHAARLHGRVVVPKHVLDPVITVRDTHIDPVQYIVLPASVPHYAKTENIPIELVLDVPIVHDEPAVNDVAGDPGIREELPEFAAMERPLYILNEFDMPAFGVVHREA